MIKALNELMDEMNLDARIILESTLQVLYVFISGACLFLLGRKAIELHYTV